MNNSEIAALRQSYSRSELLENNALANPIEQFEQWFNEALKAKVLEPNAMTISTISDEKPHARIVLLKGFDEKGFVFYTNYLSNKGKEIAENGFACLTFFWGDLERQIRIEGNIEKVSAEESDEYYHARPRGNQIGAWVSEQSKVIENRAILQEKLEKYEAKFKNFEKIPRPDHWGGYRVMPERIEFWQGRPNRLHDRLLYTKSENAWKIERLSP